MTGNITMAALLTAVALIVFYIEAQLPALTPIPGIKLGLANIITLFALYALGRRYALSVLIARVILGGLLTGQTMAIIYSISGGIPALVMSMAIYRRFKLKKVWVVSVFAAIVHNCGQIGAAMIITGTAEIVLYLPLLIISGIITGAFTGLCAQFLLIKMDSAGAIQIKIHNQNR